MDSVLKQRSNFIKETEMKKTKNIFKIGVLALGLLSVGSCANKDILELDLTQNPNALSPEQADPDFLLNKVQVDYADWIESFGYTGAQVTRIDQMSGRDYTSAYGPTAFDGRWSSAYRGMMEDLAVMNELAQEAELTHHIAMGQFMQAHILMTLVDFFGDVPYSEALQGADNLNPVADSGASVYQAAMDLLVQAKANFESSAAADPQYDFFYDGDWDDSWVRAVNTLMMKGYMTTRLADGSALSSFNAIVASGNYINDNKYDLQFGWGKNEVQPDNRHPRYAADYTATGGGRYRSNWLMGKMLDDEDPRRLFYFYRQNEDTPGFGADPDEETLECSLQTKPAHLEDYVWCGLPAGYWGRDHGNDNGIPPDGFLRTLHGVYPAGGTFDDASYDGQVNGDGQGGAGVTPVLLASWADFLIAEAAMVSGDAPAAKTAMINGMTKSVEKVTGFYDSGLDLETSIMNHADEIDAQFDASTDQMEVVAEQFFIALYGNGIEAYNFYRRTGYPKSLQPNVEPNPGGFIRSFFYPANYANTNQNASQKGGVDVQVFWDTNSASPGFPAAN